MPILLIASVCVTAILQEWDGRGADNEIIETGPLGKRMWKCVPHLLHKGKGTNLEPHKISVNSLLYARA